MDKKHINFKEFDSFIQNSLNKYFYVQPWQKLYDRTGKFHKDIISDKSTIPDLIIYNKSFNKSECFYESNRNSYIKFPRMRFILRPKYKKEYNPIDTYGKDDECFVLINHNEESKDIQKENKNELDIIKENNINNNEEKKEENEEFDLNDFSEKENSEKENQEEEEEDDPEWANDNVENFADEEIKFKAIPKSIEEQYEKEENEQIVNNIDKIEECSDDKININIDKFFADDNNSNLNEFVNNKNNINNSDKSKNFIRNKNNDNMINNKKIKLKNKGNNDKTKRNSNDYFNIFDTQNKFKNIYLEEENENEDDYSNENDNNLNIDLNKQKLMGNNINNYNRNFVNIVNNQNQNYLPNNIRNPNTNYIYNIYNNNCNMVNLNNINLYPFNTLGINNKPNYIQNIQNLNLNNINQAKFRRNTIPSPNVNNINMNNKELYVHNLNNLISRIQAQNAIRNNLINNLTMYQNNFYNYNNIIPLNNNAQNIPNIPRNNIILNPQNLNNNIPIYNNINNNSMVLNNKFDINNTKQKNINNVNDENKKEENDKTDNQEGIEPAVLAFLENPDQILIKNMNEKKWLVFEKDKSNFIRNFNTRELYEFLKEREGQESFNDLTINDSDTDCFFPTREIYENLKKFFSYM